MIFGKPKIIIAMSTMMSGGIEKSLVTLLNALNGKDLNITLLLNEKRGIFMNYIPEYVKVIQIPYNRDIINERKQGRKRFLINLVSRFKLVPLLKYLRIFANEKSLQHDEMMIQRFRRYQNGILDDNIFDCEYDLAVAYADFEQMVLVANKIKSHRKTLFFHTQIDGLTNNIRAYAQIFKSFDTLFCVSRDLTSSMKKHFPEFENRIKYFPHIIDVKRIRKAGKEYIEDWPGSGIKILSVGRLEMQKGFDLIPEIAKILKNSNIEFQWVILGEGPKRTLIENGIKEHHVTQEIFLLGTRENPYPFFSSCDIYVQPSRYEGYCLTVAEARVFAKPIVATVFDGSEEQLEGGKYGKIVKFNIEELYLAIKEMCINTETRTYYTESLKKQNVENSEGIDMFLKEVVESRT